MDGEKEYRTEQIARWIREEIESGNFLPGTRLEERPLCERFGVSKTPVREALIQLSSIGLIDLRQKRGAIVTQLNIEQVISMFEVMAELESMAAKLAATRMSSSDQDELGRLHLKSRQFVKRQDVEKYDSLNREFHERIYRGSHNDYLETTIKDVRSRLRVYRSYPFQRADRMRQSFNDHASILTAIAKGDADSAALTMRNHITQGGQLFANLVVELSRKK